MRAAMFVLVAGLIFSPAGAWAADPPQGWEFVGRTQAAATVEVRARVTGYLTQVAVKEGDAVAKGDLLIEIDPRPYQLAVDEELARVKAAEAKLQAARITADNTKRLQDNKVISSDELGLKLTAVAEAEAEFAVAKVGAERAKLNLAWTRITAPFDGRVSHIFNTAGNLVAADQTQILSVVSTDPLHVSFKVPEAILLQLSRDGFAESNKLNVMVGFADEEGHPHIAKLDLIEPEVDPKTGSVRLRATVTNPPEFLLPGMLARVRLVPAPQ